MGPQLFGHSRTVVTLRRFLLVYDKFRIETGQALLPTEAEAYIEALDTFQLKDIGSQKWSQQHEYIEKINMQAVINAANQEDEFIKEFLINHEKIPVLVHELL